MASKYNDTRTELHQLIEESVCARCNQLTLVQFEEIIECLLMKKSSLDEEVVQYLLNSKNQIAELRDELKLNNISVDASITLIKVIVTDLSETYDYIDDAANKLITGIEELGNLSKGNEQVERILSNMLMSCDFHDLAGQRLIRVIKNLQRVESSVIQLLKIFPISPDKNSFSLMETGAEYGPAMNDCGVKQDFVDAFLKQGSK